MFLNHPFEQTQAQAQLQLYETEPVVQLYVQAQLQLFCSQLLVSQLVQFTVAAITQFVH